MQIFSNWIEHIRTISSKLKKLDKVLNRFIDGKVAQSTHNIYSVWSTRLQEKRRIDKIKNKLFHRSYKKIVTNLFHIWVRKYKHICWIQVNTQSADKIRHQNLLRYAFRIWNGADVDWKAAFYHSHIFPVQHQEKQILKGAILLWKEFIDQKKQFQQRLIDAKNWRKDFLLKETLRKWFEFDQANAWKMQKRSGYSNRELYVACKYGRKWRSEAMKSPRKGCRTMENKCDDRFITRNRPAPRKPSFLFDIKTSRFIKTQSISTDQTVPSTPTHAVTIPNQTNHVVPAVPILQDNPKHLISPEIQPKKSFKGLDDHMEINNTQPITALISIPDPLETASQLNIEVELEKMKSKMVELQQIQKECVEVEQELLVVETKLQSYADCEISHQFECSLIEMIEIRGSLIHKLSNIGNKKIQAKSELIDIRKAIGTLI